MALAVIPARGGSKRIPRKNIKPFCGKPMIAWSIEAALNSHCFERVVVSTDDEEIAEVARSYGAETPFVRPQKLSDDYTGTSPVVRHAIETLKEQGESYDEVCCIYATAPFLVPEFLSSAKQMLTDHSCPYVFSICSFPYPIQRAVKLSDSGHVEKFEQRNFNVRSQDLEEAFHDAGQFYWGTSEAWLSKESVFSGRAQGFVLPRSRVQDIDTHEDWERAELMMKALEVGK
ncbi:MULTISPECIES: pseudaminic acid cytidylyltransferase [Gammaproteobacteria]|uniref:pseudaminic acid cytidylyltransferase n=1 Tax=Gammaproteobacteria TaxID=1236 RepID=UPI000DCFE7BF|nr:MULTISPECIES: pseudaminic acid cytidylyltransferase [Gammaproteobacteria]RTE86815.1 pseudaminic acid cytidylyltransferase [Aliidiomarina sp. B3213]TCZ93396.1 pseudaminic acid cytidylyltransferase [Lysobacter sp. N42]